MCNGEIIKVWHQNDPLPAYKAVETYLWSLDFSRPGAPIKDEYREWMIARPRIIGLGGGAGAGLVETWTFVGGGSKTIVRDYISKSVRDYLSGDLELSEEAQLSGWHAWPTPPPGEYVVKVELRGVMQESSKGELVASEMRVVEWLDGGWSMWYGEEKDGLRK